MREIHILRTPGRYVGQLRMRGARTWKSVTGKCATSAGAMRGTARHFTGNYHRFRIVFVPSGDSYYGPHVVFEGRRH